MSFFLSFSFLFVSLFLAGKKMIIECVGESILRRVVLLYLLLLFLFFFLIIFFLPLEEECHVRASCHQIYNHFLFFCQRERECGLERDFLYFYLFSDFL